MVGLEPIDWSHMAGCMVDAPEAKPIVDVPVFVMGGSIGLGTWGWFEEPSRWWAGVV